MKRYESPPLKRVLRWAGALFGLLAFALLVAIAWGTSLPMNHRATCSATIPERLHVVWQTAFDDTASAQWRPNIARVDFGPPRHDGDMEWIETDKNGHATTYQLVSTRVDRQFVRRIDDKTLPFGGSWTFDFARAPRGTKLMITENGQIYNPVFRFMARYVLGYTATMHEYLADLGKHFGESPQIDCTTAE